MLHPSITPGYFRLACPELKLESDGNISVIDSKEVVSKRKLSDVFWGKDIWFGDNPKLAVAWADALIHEAEELKKWAASNEL